MSRTARAVHLTDQDIREELRILDRSDQAGMVDVGRWAADFIENVAFRQTAPLSRKQRRKALQILEEHGC